MEQIGAIRFLRRYPVKSMKGEDLERAEVKNFGIEGDRVFAFVDNKNPEKDFPWMTARQKHEMILFRTRFLGGSSMRSVEVITPEGNKFKIPDLEFEKYLEMRFRYDLSLKFDEAGMKDSLPISLIGLDSIATLSKEVGMAQLRHERFRANFYAEWFNNESFYEDKLIGSSLRLGDKAVVNLVKKDSRCVIPTLEIDTAESNPEILKTIQRNHQGCIGVYATTEKEGLVKLGDPISLE